MEPLALLLHLPPTKTVARAVKGTIFSAKKELPGTLTARLLTGSKLRVKGEKIALSGPVAMRMHQSNKAEVLRNEFIQ